MDRQQLNRQQLKDALAWQVDIGVDAALWDKPAGDVKPITLSKWMAAAAEFSHEPKTPDPSSEAFSSTVSQMPISELKEAASAQLYAAPAQPISQPMNSATPSQGGLRTDLSQIDSLDSLKMALNNFEGCALKHTASNLVFADGNPDARIMLIGEAPGRDEDRLGLPFVGAAGQLLDKMLKSIGLDRTSVYICNILPWRPPGNRTPTSEETQMLWPFLLRHIQLKAPQIIMALGGSSAKLLLDETTGILKLRGQITERDFGLKDPIPVLPSLHPAYLLRSPGQKRLSYQDLLKLQTFMDGMK